MTRILIATLVALTFALGAHAHFIYLVPAADGTTLKVVLSDGLDVDDEIDAAKFAATKLTIRGQDGKETDVPVTKASHHLDATLSGKGPRLVFGTTDYGVLQKGDAKPFRLKYHSKALLSGVTKATAKVGKAAPVEIVPEVDGSKIRFQVLAESSALGDAEVSLILPGDKKEKIKTDKDGWTQWFEGAGRYGAWTRYVETASGDAGGKKFDEVRHYGTLVIDVIAAK